MTLDDLKKEYVDSYKKIIEDRGKFDLNDYDELKNELNGEKEFEIDEENYQFIEGFKDEDDNEYYYGLEEEDKADIMINVYNSLTDERLKEEYLNTMLEKRTEIPYKVTTYFENIREKQEETNEEEQEIEEAKGRGVPSGAGTTKSGEEPEPPKNVQPTPQLSFDTDGPAIKFYKEQTEELEKELARLEAIKEENEKNINPIDIIDSKIKESDDKINEIDNKIIELDSRGELVEKVIANLSNYNNRGDYKDDYTNVTDAFTRIDEAPERTVDDEFIIATEKVTEKLNAIKLSIETEENSKKITMTAVSELTAEIANISDDNLRNKLLGNANKIAEIVRKPVNERDFNEAYTKVEESLIAIKTYYDILSTNNRAAKLRAKFKNEQSEPYETLADRNLVFESAYELDLEILRFAISKGYANKTEEELSNMDGFMIEAETERVINAILAKPNGQEELESFIRDYRLANRGIEDQKEALKEEKNSILEEKKHDYLTRQKIESILKNIESLNKDELDQDAVKNIQEEINNLEVEQEIKEKLQDELLNKINGKEQTNNNDLEARINELKKVIGERKENTNLYYECLKDIKNVSDALKNGTMKFNDENFKKAIADVTKKMEPLPTELKQELMEYIKGLGKKKITDVQKNPKLTWKTFAMTAAGFGAGLFVGFNVATFGLPALIIGNAAFLGAKWGINKLRDKARQERLNGTHEIEGIEAPTNEQKTIFQKFKDYIKSEEGLRDISWGLTGGMIGFNLGYINGQQPKVVSNNTPEPVPEPTPVEPTPEPVSTTTDFEIGQTIGEGHDLSTGFKSPADSLNSSNVYSLNNQYVNGTNTIHRMAVKGADGAWQNISTPGVKVSDLLAQGYSESDIAFSLANNGTDVAWIPYERFAQNAVETIARTR